jgi:general secretion pathway protein F
MQFQYRALAPGGAAVTGRIQAADRAAALVGVRRTGATPIELVPVADTAPPAAKPRAKDRAAAATSIGELAVLLDAGLQLDRALALAVENVEDAGVARHLADILRAVREGAPLSRAMADKPQLFTPVAIAMTEAGEANGRLAEALSRLSDALEREAELRRIVASAMIYPIALLTIAVGVVLLMLLFVVPQFESMFVKTTQQLPTATVAVMGASRFLRDNGLLLLLLGGGAVAAGSVAMRQPAARAARDRAVLRVPQLGELVRRIETARFVRTLGALIEGEVSLPVAVALAQRTIGNRAMASAIGAVATGVKEGGGLTAPLAATRALPRLAIGFFRTGEETSRLGPMLLRLADVLDRDVRTRIERAIGILTPVITVALGTTVAGIIASIMSAILGFNDLAVTS